MGDAAKREIDSKNFVRRLESILNSWKTLKDSLWGGADALVIPYGTGDGSVVFKVSALQLWLLGWEVPEMFIVIAPKSIYVVSSPFKISIFAKLPEKIAAERPDLPQIKLRPRQKTEDAKTVFADILKELKGIKKIGVLKEEHTGALVDGFNAATEDAGLSQVDIESGFSNLFAVKDKVERNNVKTAASISAAVMKKFLIPDLETIIDKGDSIEHSKLSEKIEKLFYEPQKISPKLESTAQTVEPCFVPIIQSGGNFDLRLTAVSNDDTLQFGTIVCVLGTRYRSYCASVGRTLFINPTPEQKANYTLLLEIQQEVLKQMRPGTPLSKVMETAKALIAKKKPHLQDNFLDHCGFGTGVELQENHLLLDSANKVVFKDGMVFTLTLGFHNLENTGAKDSKDSNYSIFLVDTVLVEDAKTLLLTENVRSAYKDVSYSMEDEDDDKLAHKPIVEVLEATSRRSKNAELEQQKRLQEEKRRQRQEDLARKAQEEAQRRLQKSANSDNKGAELDDKDRIAYESSAEFPDVPSNKIYVDTRKEVLLLPIFGTHVPFHISTIRKVSKSGERDLRILFIFPGAGIQGGSKLPPQVAQALSFVREMTFRYPDVKNLNNMLRIINDIKKASAAREIQKREMQGLTKQKKLILMEGRPIQLQKVFIRPSIGGRSKAGVLSAHKNGFRFSTGTDNVVDILYENIKHAFFQPCDQELIVLIHFRLKNAILVGKKKTIDVQFFQVVMEVSEKVGPSGPQSFEEEVEEEQREKRHIEKVNNDFHNFVRKVEELNQDLDFDIPYRDLGFTGAPNRANALLLPTRDCLVQLSEPPFFVITLSEIELANLERVTAGVSKHFDLVFVLKDHTQPVVTIRAIPFQSLDSVKDWLDTCDIVCYEGPQSLNWPNLLKYVLQDEKAFYKEGGWKPILETPPEEELDSESEEDDFKPQEDSDDDEFDDDEDDDDEYSEDDEDDESDASEEDSDEEDDWEELERKAKKEDKARGAFDKDTRPGKRNAAYSDEEDSDDSEDDRRSKKPPAKKAKVSSSSSAPRPGAARPGTSSSSSRPGAPRPGGSSSSSSQVRKPASGPSRK